MSIPAEVREALSDWVNSFRAAAERDGWRWLTEEAGYDEEPPGEIGPDLVERMIEAVTMIVTVRFMGAGPDPAHAAAARAFLERQAYGVPAEQRGARYRLRFLGSPCEVELYVETLAEVDLEDFEAILGFGGLEIAAVGRALQPAEAEGLLRAVYEDLTWDGDLWEIDAALDRGVLTLWPRPRTPAGEE
ncbi:MAG: hypothetical protein ABIO70_04390 [Pseudomonadota bacterium]